jgi:hypothetical protein
VPKTSESSPTVPSTWIRREPASANTTRSPRRSSSVAYGVQVGRIGAVPLPQLLPGEHDAAGRRQRRTAAQEDGDAGDLRRIGGTQDLGMWAGDERHEASKLVIRP